MTASILRLRTVFFVAILAGLVAITGCEVEDEGDMVTVSTTANDTTTSNNPASATINFTDAGFDSADATIRPGGAVTWNNNSTAEMVIDFADADSLQSSGTIAIGASYTGNFPQAGSFVYTEVNSGLTGTITVQ